MSPEKASPKASSEMALGTNQLSTALISQAREKTARMRTAPQLPKNKLVSLLVTEGPLKGTTYPIEKPQISIGRTKADIVLNDSKVSRTHCVLEVHDQSGLLVDLDSGNGTFVDGKKIVSVELEHMSEFRVGGTTLMFALTSRM